MRFSVAIVIAAVCLTMLSQIRVASAARTTEAEAAIAAAAKQNRYMFVTFFRDTDDTSAKMIREVKAVVQEKLSDRAGFISVDTTSPSNAGLVSRYDADRSPMPLTIVVAPNGALTAGFPVTIPSEVLKAGFPDVFVTNDMAEVLGALQNGKLAAICFQNSKTMHNKESMAAAKGLSKDKNFRGAVVLIVSDPADSAESALLKMCSVEAGASEATLVVVAPPGTVVGNFPGATTREEVVAALTKALGGGCSGGNCGPNGCG